MKYPELLARFNKGEVLEWENGRYSMGLDKVSVHQAVTLLGQAKPYHSMPSARGGQVFFKTPGQAKEEQE